MQGFWRKIATVGGLTAISRVLGLLRDVLIASILGAGLLADAFFVAFRIPNMLRRFMAEGAVSVGFVPVFNEVKEREDLNSALQMARAVMTLMFFVLCGVVIVGEILAPWLVMLIAPGFVGDPIFADAVHLTRVMFPYIMLIGMVALFMGILNSLEHFAAPAAAPILLNIFMIGVPLTCYVWQPVFASPADALAWGVVLGGIAQVLLQIGPMRRRGVPLKPSSAFRDKRIKRMARLVGVSAVGASAYQLTVLVGTLLASLLGAGAVSYLYYAGRVLELPLGIFAFAVSNVMLPSMSSAWARGDQRQLSELTGQAISSVLLFTLPASLGLILLAEPIIEILFLRGAFGAEDVSGTARALVMYALALWAIGCSRILTQVLYAMQEAKLVVRMLWVTLAIFVVAGVALMRPMGHVGIALASSLSVLLQLALLMLFVGRRGVKLPRSCRIDVIKMTLATMLMGAALLPLLRWLDWGAGLSVQGLLALCGSILAGVVVYFSTLIMLKFNLRRR